MTENDETRLPRLERAEVEEAIQKTYEVEDPTAFCLVKSSR